MTTINIFVFSSMSYRGFIKNRIDFIIDEFPEEVEIHYFEKPIFIDYTKIKLALLKFKDILRPEFNTTNNNKLQLSLKGGWRNIGRIIGLKKRIGRIGIIGQLPALTFLGNILPLYEKLDFIFRRFIIAGHINSIIQNLQENPIILLVCHPWWSNIVKDMDYSVFCYDCSDDLKNYTIESKLLVKMQEWHANTISKSDIVFVSSQKIASDILRVKSSTNIKLIPNGVDAEWFYHQANHIPIPNDIEKINSPRIGYVGNIIFPWLDLNNILAVAISNPFLNFIFVGWVIDSTLIEKLKGAPNIFFLGGKDYSNIPAYMKAFDVCMLPFKIEDKLDSNDTLVMYEYLSLGKPVVASKIKESEKFKELIYLYEDKAGFIDGIQKSLGERDETLKQRRIAVSRENTWEKRAETMISLIINYG